jgi:hypothetical protein
MTVPSKADIDKKKRSGPTPSIKVGDKFLHTLYGEYTITSYEDAHTVGVRFEVSGYSYILSASEIRCNHVKDATQVRVYGVGINDANYRVITKVRKGRGSLNGSKCPFWTKWISMLDRCYSGNHSSYADTVVCDAWLRFSNFKAWMETQDWGGKDLDKDLFGDGTLYSPETCCFLQPKVNTFITSHAGGYSLSKSTGKFQARCTNPFAIRKEDGRYLGLFCTKEEAHKAWQAKKHEYACQLAELQEDSRVADALRQRYAPDKDWSKL